MGIVRLYLALSVVAVHMGASFGVTGRSAVCAFYMISGFLITLLLNTAYKNQNFKFVVSRFMRILCPYVAVFVVASSALYYIGYKFNFERFSISEFTLLSISNATLLGQDLLWFFSHSPGDGIYYSGDSDAPAGYNLYRTNPIQPAFTLSIELYFYVLAPFLVRTFRRALTFFLLSSIIAFFISWVSTNPVLWGYHFFGGVSVYFAVGALSYYLLVQKVTVHKSRSQKVVFSIGFAFFCFSNNIFPTVYALLVFFALPLMADVNRRSSTDRLLGDISYGVYLTHFPVILMLNAANFSIGSHTKVITVMLISILLGLALRSLVERPLDRLRHRHFRPQSA